MRYPREVNYTEHTNRALNKCGCIFCRLLLLPYYCHTSVRNWARSFILPTLSNYDSQHKTSYVQEVSDNLKKEPGKLHPVKCDVTKEQDILAAFSWIKERLGGVDIMINNAGVLHQSFLTGRLTEMRWEAGVTLLLCLRARRLSRADAVPTEGAIQITGVRGTDYVAYVFVSSR
jgi:hypothetical protein